MWQLLRQFGPIHMHCICLDRSHLQKPTLFRGLPRKKLPTQTVALSKCGGPQTIHRRRFSPLEREYAAPKLPQLAVTPLWEVPLGDFLVAQGEQNAPTNEPLQFYVNISYTIGYSPCSWFSHLLIASFLDPFPDWSLSKFLSPLAKL